MPDFIRIPLTKGKFAIIDTQDLLIVGQFSWRANEHSPGRWYARRSFRHDGRQSSEQMHRRIVGPPVGLWVDHINGDGLDNRRSNLRLCTRQQNTANQAVTTTGASGFRGVRRFRNTTKWQAQIKVNQRSLHLGQFNTPEEAAHAYDAAAWRAFGPFATLNFPRTK